MLAKVLLVDDLKTNLLTMSMVLEPLEELECIMAQSGEEALKLLTDHDVALILLDVNMPGMDGFELAQRLQEDENFKHIPIIFVTATDRNTANDMKGYDLGAVDFIYKPIESLILLSKVKTFIDLWRLRAGLEIEMERVKEREEEILYLIGHDTLTKLPNRNRLHEILSTEIEHSRHANKRFALLYIDIDGFKSVNDLHGHKAGDDLLIHLAVQFKKAIYPGDTIARYGGDEFIGILRDVKDEFSIVKRLQALVDVASSIYHWKGNEIHVGASIGVTFFPDHGRNDTELISNSDTAMYLAKREGKNSFRFYTHVLNEELQRRLSIEQALYKALDNNEFTLNYQPFIELKLFEIMGAEVLIRWNSPTLGFVPPDEFIAVAEANGLITPIGLWVFEQTLEMMRQYPELTFAINVSSLQLSNDQLINAMRNAIDEGRLNPGKLEVEITERLMLEEDGSQGEHLLQLHEMGISLSIDDFGTGYSSLSYLKNASLSTLKIDKSFICELPNHEDEALCRMIIAMADALHIKVIAEGVETLEQANLLRYAGADIAQGYWFAKPLSQDDFKTYIDEGGYINLHKDHPKTQEGQGA